MLCPFINDLQAVGLSPKIVGLAGHIFPLALSLLREHPGPDLRDFRELLKDKEFYILVR